MIDIDFETRSRVNLKTSGVWRYAEDQSTSVLCMAYTSGDSGEPELWTPETHDLLDTKEIIKAALARDEMFIAHNAAFEIAIYYNVMMKRYGFPAIPVTKWRCSAAKAAAHAIPRGLADACGALALDMQKDKGGRALMLKMCKPRKPTKNNPSEWYDSPEDYESLYAYCKQDIRAEVGLYKRLPDLIPFEQKVWALDQKMNARGITVDVETINAANYLINCYRDRMTEELNNLTGSAVGSADERDKMKTWCELNGLELENMQKGTLVDALEGDMDPTVRRVLEIRQQLGKKSTAKYQALIDAVCADGRLRDTLMYHGASTGRWAGKGPQPQNLPRNTRIKDVDTAVEIIRRRDPDLFEFCYEDPMDALSQMVRSMFTASPGKILVGGDYSAIEVRVLFWLAGENAGLNMFRKGEDLYVDLAKKIYQTETATKAQRELGKRGILGCGYGMGHSKFIDTCKQNANLVIDEDFSKKVVQIYRSTYSSVVTLWNEQEAAAIEAVRRGTTVTCGKIKWRVANGFLYARLPSGRCLAYCHPKIEMVETPWGAQKEALTFMSMTNNKWQRGSTYGGSIVENLTQAVARDLMADAMIKVESVAFDMLLTVHDELITETSDRAILPDEHLKKIMEDTPAWAEGLPVKAETWWGYRYSK